MISRLPMFAAWSQLSSSRRREALAGYLFISPWLIGFIVFFVGPIIASFILSFTSWNIVGTPTWVGLENYQTIFTNDPRFIKSIQVTLTYSVFYLPLEVICGILLAVLMNQ
ncbi:MAG: sugar ABC transporter permease, partial [Chitinophagaceae bacterium]|nr:sugar ABC transporter permease [Anaerolineae bacterium]